MFLCKKWNTTSTFHPRDVLLQDSRVCEKEDFIMVSEFEQHSKGIFFFTSAKKRGRGWVHLYLNPRPLLIAVLA